MMVWPAHGVPRPVGLATWRVVHNVARRCNVARLYNRLSVCFTGHDNTVCAYVLDVPR
jgi:hypothetical protein